MKRLAAIVRNDSISGGRAAGTSKGDMDDFAFYACSGLCRGAIYALIALGYTMVYGIVKLINFAHGEFYMAGAYAGFGAYCLLPADLSPWLSIPLTLLASGFAGALVALVAERIAYRPVRDAGRLAALLTAIGTSFLLQSLASFVNRANPLQYPSSVEGSIGELCQRATLIGGSGIRTVEFAYLAIAAVLAGALWLLVAKSSFGRAMRAVSQDAQAAALMGIDANKAIAGTFALGGFLAGVAGTLVAFESVAEPMMGFMTGLKAFIAAVLGGIGSIPGAVLGGLLLGLLESLLIYAGVPSGSKDIAAFAALIAILLLRPQGLLGSPAREKV